MIKLHTQSLVLIALVFAIGGKAIAQEQYKEKKPATAIEIYPGGTFYKV